MRIAVCAPQVPFERGGTEILAETLVEQLRGRDHEVELVRIPFKWYPGPGRSARRSLWRLLDLEEAQGRPIDLVIATKFPSYAIRHPNKVVWLVHQFRQAYELDRTDFGQFGEDPFDRATVRAIHRLDRTTLGEARRLFAISQNVADRLRALDWARGRGAACRRRSTSTTASDGVGEFILSVGRLDRAKRVDLLLEAAALDGSLQVVVAGEGPDRERLERLSAKRGLDGRVTFAGRVGEDELVDLYARCLAVFYAPFDEDFGLVPYEAFLSEKPVVTTRDAGGPLEVVVDRENGLVCEPRPAAVAAACSWLAANPDEARALRLARQADGGAASPGTPSSTGSLGALKVAYFSPLPPERSGIADYSALLLPALAGAARRAVVRRERTKPPRGTDVALYHVGNNPDAHGWIVDALRRRPGVVVLHDFVLHHLVAGMTLGRGDPEGYLDAMQRDAGVVGRLLAHGVVDHLLPPIWEDRARGLPARRRGPRPRRRRHLPLAGTSSGGAGVRLCGPDLGDPDAGLALGRARRRAWLRRVAPR